MATHDPNHAHEHHGTDLKAGLTGFFVGLAFLLIFVYAVSRWTTSLHH